MKNQGDLEARKKLIEHNLRLVRHVAIKYLSVMKQPLDDVISIGIFGLIKAVDFFDITKNIKFSSYDFKAISNEYNRYLQLNVGTKRDYSNDISLEQSIGNYNDPDSLTLGDTLSTDEDIEEIVISGVTRKEELFKAISRLNVTKQKIIILRYGLTSNGRRYTLEEIGKIFNCTRERARQIEVQILNKLRHPSITKKLLAYYRE